MHLYTALVSLLAVASNAHVGHAEYRSVKPYAIPFSCGTTDAPRAFKEHAAHLNVIEAKQRQSVMTSAVVPIVINTYVHVVTSAEKQGWYSKAQVQQQIAIMNNSYAPQQISFTLKSIDFTVNDTWAAAGQDYDLAMKSALRKGTYASLNLYFKSDMFDVDTYEGVLGYCYLPGNVTTGSDGFYYDGCVNSAETMPGGNITDYNLGGTATHETGHWFGLLHVFQNYDCADVGDQVDDTPRQKVATYGCPDSQDSCPNRPGVDSVHNYMDYSTDACYNQFTSGQATRMRNMYNTYRKGN